MGFRAPIDPHQLVVSHGRRKDEVFLKLKELLEPQSQPLATRAILAKRRQIAAEVKPWEKSPMYLKAQQAKAAAAEKSGRKKGTQKG